MSSSRIYNGNRSKTWKLYSSIPQQVCCWRSGPSTSSGQPSRGDNDSPYLFTRDAYHYVNNAGIRLRPLW
ncbi:hypothetical protein BDV32DRAFT_132394 [Aspergillus pseudonomiae]|nr:hypothetical protein BDV32DRAFT_132394 [Aspergillus pseudonomiae]